MITIIVLFHILASFFLVVAILMQSSKGHGLAGTFGGMGSMGTVFGGRGAAPFLSKVTIVLATVFVVSCLIQGFLFRGRAPAKSLIQREAQRQKVSSPAEVLPKAPSAGSEELFLPAQRGAPEQRPTKQDSLNR